MTIAKCTKTAASSNVSNHLSRTPAAWCASGAAHHARPYRNLGRRISLRSYTIVGITVWHIQSIGMHSIGVVNLIGRTFYIIYDSLHGVS